MRNGQVGQVGQGNRRFIRASEIEAEPIDWIWPHFIPIGAITLLEGDPELGKSKVVYDLAACVSTGDAMPYRDANHRDPSGVVLCVGEDSLSGTVKPALISARANLDNVVLLQSLQLPKQLDEVVAAIVEANAGLLVIDPISAFFHHLASEHRARAAMNVLQQLADRHHVAVVLVRHLRKKSANNSKYSGYGSIALRAAARSTLSVEGDPQGTMTLAHSGNLCREGSIRYRLRSKKDGIVVDWLPMLSVVARTHRQSELEKAKAFLVDTLGSGPRPSNDIFAEATGAGITRRTLRRAKEDLHVDHFVVAHSGRRYTEWSLPPPKTAFGSAFLVSLAQLLRSSTIKGTAESPMVEEACGGIKVLQAHITSQTALALTLDGVRLNFDSWLGTCSIDLRDSNVRTFFCDLLDRHGISVIDDHFDFGLSHGQADPNKQPCLAMRREEEKT